MEAEQPQLAAEMEAKFKEGTRIEYSTTEESSVPVLTQTGFDIEDRRQQMVRNASERSWKRLVLPPARASDSPLGSVPKSGEVGCSILASPVS
ncbi:hypothetical protein [Nocardia noduli]|uniref:hypothetical protein n=1 Tax=Nocardia noduli TaxID=2815722 RepID=UPI001C2473C4|nr:hypothetical protein [Nocardia noduli]